MAIHVEVCIGAENISRYRSVFRERVTILILPSEFDEFMREHVTPGIVESLYYVAQACRVKRYTPLLLPLHA